ncbi:bifunctional DNA-formamidopyrimidine glycosylase/DNA-(apurinic or apyrimidinic site) lyase [Altererythrobacter sp. KTW20L]|uniref:bifunctional DNA-formamidopyrimidine glycosylase/DNA-(apurinic or apyrimidinic site) lyase n=1 Tax=Altererythrobacter sp. KTW20L TaxID=2942210 RepID=UPI00209ABBCC|nr:bifunctional DNA-formamidopyrimidine glycosylase/DNA-(apurinic or apyrimidinic site) lyase [Altererythrobacter sp. KTW20L]MCL6251440.1 bifunctional DNA-formamidopyrimidine glycosylase/DNA-(apurinic or apyrimidinic site) lyase [Altererythrobacter sp. KTW20L]
MPELPEVETTVRGLERFLLGQRISHVQLNRPDMRFAFPAGLVQALVGATVTSLGRRAKYGLIHTDRDSTLIFHLGMSGTWRIDPVAADKHDHLVLDAGDHRFTLNDPRRFGFVDLVDTPLLGQWPAFAVMGPEPLGDDLDTAHLHRALAGRSQAIKLMLLDQKVVAGLGNIYVCEALFAAGIDPRKAAGKVSKPALARLVPAIRAVLMQSIADGGSTLRDYMQPDGELGYFATRFAVYGREGEACLHDDGGVIRRIVQGGRSTWFCPKCQR